jgi:hypothetical protein
VADKSLTTDSLEEEFQLAAVADFHGVNVPPMWPTAIYQWFNN